MPTYDGGTETFMTEILLYSFLCFIIIYIAYRFTAYLVNPIQCKHIPQDSLCTVVFVKNQADAIESTLRFLIWQTQTFRKTNTATDIFIVDLDSTDDSFEIISTLSRKYEFIHPMNKNGYIEFIRNM